MPNKPKLVLFVSLLIGCSPLAFASLVTLSAGEIPVYPVGWLSARTADDTLDSTQACFYVDGKAGSDANPGDSGHPWQTIQKAGEMLQAGQTGLIRSGVYHEVVRFKNSGLPGKPIQLRAEKGAEVTIDGQDELPANRWEGLIVLDGKSYIEITGLRLVHSGYAGIFCEKCAHLSIRDVKTDHTWSSGLQFWNCENLDVAGNDVRRACQGKSKKDEGTQECITLAGCGHFQVRYNHVWDRLEDVGGGGEGIDVKQASHDGSVDHNLVHDLARLGIYVDGYDRDLRNVTVAGNVVFSCGNGIVVSAEVKSGSASHVHIAGNIVFDNHENGISVSDFVEDGPRRDISIDHNTVVQNGTSKWGGGIFVATRDPESADIVIAQNVLSQNGAWQLAVQAPSLRIVTARENLIDGYRHYDGGQNDEKEITGTNPLLADPGFADRDTCDFRFREDSPPRKSGWGAAAPTPPTKRRP